MRCLLATITLTALTLSARADDGPLTVDTSKPTEWSVSFHGKRVCDYTFAPEQAKPYVRELATIEGDNLLRDSPEDHKHHHALMYAIRANGVNFWEETPGHGVEKPVGTPETKMTKTESGLQMAHLKHRIHWVAEADAAQTDTEPLALLIEDRMLTLTVVEARKVVALRWRGEFQVGPKAQEVTLTGSNYNGLGMRFLQELDPDAKHLIAGQKPDLDGAKQSVLPGDYGAVMFDTSKHRATYTIFGSPKNANGNFFFTMMQAFPYLAATQQLDQKPLTYKAGDKFTVDYVVTVDPEPKSADDLARRAEMWNKWIFETAK